MKQRHPICALLAIAMFAAPVLTIHAQTWQVLLPSPDFQPSGSGQAVLINPFSSDPASSLFVGAATYGSGGPTILRLTPTDPLSSLFTPEEVDGELTYVSRLAHIANDGLYAVGRAPKDPKARNTVDVWKVRKSNSGDASTWTEVDTFFLNKNALSVATGITTDNQGTVYVSGMAHDGRAPHWVVRRKQPTVAGWTTAYDAKGQDINMIPAMCFFPGNANNSIPAVFTASILNSKWTVLRSQKLSETQKLGDIGTWQQVDSWTGGGSAASAYDIAYDSFSGKIYVVGCRGLNGQNPSAWVIRMSEDGGDNWETLLDVAGAGSWASRVVIDGSENVTVSGVIQNSGGTPRWVVVRNSLGQSWSDSWALRTFPFDETYSKGRGVAADPFGNLFLTGDVIDWTDPEDGTFYSGTHVGLLRLLPSAPSP